MFEIVLFDNGLETAVTAMFRSGFYTENEIREFFRGIAEDDPDAGLDPESVEQEVQNMLIAASDALIQEIADWPAKTENDMLIEAFQHLNANGIRAVENFGFEASDCSELYLEIRGNEYWRGYCFYHNQDLVHAVLGGGLAVRFSAAVDQPTADDNRGIGDEIVNVLRGHGLRPEWNSDPRRVISMAIDWRRRPLA